MFNYLKKQAGSASAALFGFILVILVFAGVVYGYVENILKLCALQSGHTGETVVRAVGILVAPLGIIAGYVHSPF